MSIKSELLKAPSQLDLQHHRNLANLQRQLDHQKSLVRHLEHELESSEKRSQLLEEISRLPVVSQWTADKRKTRKGEATAIVALSDWHVGEVIRRQTVNGKNEFNPEIASRRIERVFTKIPEYVDRYVPMATEIVLWLGGDFITGYIHEELEESNSMSPTEECLFFIDHFSSGLAHILDRTKQNIKIVTSWGNHGRTTKKKRCSTAATNSFEWMAYRVLEKQWQHATRVKWQIGEGYHSWISLHGRDVRFHHGDAINYWGGVGGITVPVNKAVSQWNKQRWSHLDVFGHFHQVIDGGNWVCNGSLIGYGPFSLQIKAGYEEPMQTFMVVDKNKWFRQLTRIYCD